MELGLHPKSFGLLLGLRTGTFWVAVGGIKDRDFTV